MSGEIRAKKNIMPSIDFKELQVILLGTIKREVRVEYLHGYLTAVECAPEIILPSVWIPLILGERGEEPEFSNSVDGKIVLEKVFLLFSGISKSLSDGTFKPLYSIEQVELTEDIMRLWCRGFILGLNLWKEQLFNDENATRMILPVYLAMDRKASGQLFKSTNSVNYSTEQIEEYLSNAINLIPENIINLWRHTHRKYQKIDITERNKPCPCKSGKKYKNCCGKIF